jgi:hypothetical protein
MLRKRLTRNLQAGPLTLALMDFLLDGQTRPVDQVPAAEREMYDSFLEFDHHPPEEIRGLWENNRRVLLAEWERRGKRGLPWCAKVQA